MATARWRSGMSVLGEINDSQRLAWERAITVFDESTGMTEQMGCFQ